MEHSVPKPLMLMILDGWGMPEHGEADALALSALPEFRQLWHKYPHTELSASGLDVGLPAGQMGNSEVGHMNIGAGRIIYQELTLISKSIADGDFFSNPALLSACRHARENNTALHLMGLVSDGGVHSHLTHLFALLDLAKRQQVPHVFIHCFMDGRDTAPDSGYGFISQIEAYCEQHQVGKVADVCGRFYAMDRDKRWERVQLAYEMLVHGSGHIATSGAAAVQASYDSGVSDEFIEPTVIIDKTGVARALLQDGDSVIFFNFRTDRARELSHALTDTEFSCFDRGEHYPHLGCFVTMTAYDDTLQNVKIAFPPHRIVNTFSEVISSAGLRQLRIAETEKYAHVTFFFNGGVETVSAGEDRVLIPSPKVKTYDLQPEMSAPKVTDAVIERISSGDYDVIILNFANPDMVGHTGVLPAACDAVSCVDTCLGKVVRAVQSAGGSLLITADHGNVECLKQNGQPMTAHTTNHVPCLLVDEQYRDVSLHQGRLEDIAPTLLDLLHLPQPAEMTGHSLINKEVND